MFVPTTATASRLLCAVVASLYILLEDLPTMPTMTMPMTMPTLMPPPVLASPSSSSFPSSSFPFSGGRRHYFQRGRRRRAERRDDNDDNGNDEDDDDDDNGASELLRSSSKLYANSTFAATGEGKSEIRRRRRRRRRSGKKWRRRTNEGRDRRRPGENKFLGLLRRAVSRPASGRRNAIAFCDDDDEDDDGLLLPRDSRSENADGAARYGDAEGCQGDGGEAVVVSYGVEAADDDDDGDDGRNASDYVTGRRVHPPAAADAIADACIINSPTAESRDSEEDEENATTTGAMEPSPSRASSSSSSSTWAEGVATARSERGAPSEAETNDGVTSAGDSEASYERGFVREEARNSAFGADRCESLGAEVVAAAGSDNNGASVPCGKDNDDNDDVEPPDGSDPSETWGPLRPDPFEGKGLGGTASSDAARTAAASERDDDSSFVPRLVSVTRNEEEEEETVETTTANDRKTAAPPPPRFADELGRIAATATFASTDLPVVYGVAVHAFLSFFLERPFFGERGHWSPIALRIAVALVVWAMRRGALLLLQRRSTAAAFADDDGYGTSRAAAVVEVIVAVASIIVSIELLLETRREEVEGPPVAVPHSSSSPSDLEGRVIFVTGANAGIGLETARRLYRRGGTIVLGCRSRERAEEAMTDIIADDDDDGRGGDSSSSSVAASSASSSRLRFVPLDLTDAASVREAVAVFRDMDLPLHVLINNAGVMRKDREETVDGLEKTMAANHLGHFLLTNLLLPKLRATAIRERRSTRVLTVSSSLYRSARRRRAGDGTMEPGIDLNDLQCRRKEYSLFDQYAQSKLANVLFALELGRRERNRRVEPAAAAAAVAQGTRRKSASTSPSPQPGGIKKKLLLPELAPAAAAAAESHEDDEVGLGFDDIVTSPSSRARGHREEKIGPKLDKKKKKRLRPKLSPVTPEEGDDDDEVGLGFDDIVPSPSPGDGKKKKKKIRPKLRPSGSRSNYVEEKKQDDGGVGLGYGEIVRSPVVSESITSPRAVEEPVSKGETVRRGLTPTPSSKFSEEEETDSYLGFNGIASTPVTEDEGVGPGFDDIAPSPISKIEKSRRAKSSPGGEKTRRRLKPISPSKFAVDEEDETGLGFHDIVPTTPVLKDGGTGVPSPAVSSAQKSRSKLAPVPLRADEETAPEKKARKRLTQVLSPKDAEEDGKSLDFEFNDIASTSVRQKRILVPLIIEDGGGDENEDAMQCEPSHEKGTASEATVEGKALFPVQSYCLHPGLVRTDVVRDMPWYLYYPNMIFSIFLAPLQKSPSAGASCSVFCSVKDSKQFDDREGCYYVNSELQPLEDLALNVDDARKLWELSCKLVSIPMSNIDQGNTGL